MIFKCAELLLQMNLTIAISQLLFMALPTSHWDRKTLKRFAACLPPGSNASRSLIARRKLNQYLSDAPPSSRCRAQSKSSSGWYCLMEAPKLQNSCLPGVNITNIFYCLSCPFVKLSLIWSSKLGQRMTWKKTYFPFFCIYWSSVFNACFSIFLSS